MKAIGRGFMWIFKAIIFAVAFLGALPLVGDVESAKNAARKMIV
jgi:uncharacterized membrane protein